MPECSCKGINPDCYICGGWGWIGDDIQKSRTRWVPTKLRKSKKSYRKRQRIGRPTIKCPYCDRELFNLDQHVSLKHGEKWKEYLKEVSPRNPLEIKPGIFHERCEKCGAIVRDLIIHGKKAHS